MSFLSNKFHISTGQELQPDRQALYSLICAFFLSISPHMGRLPAWYAVLAIFVMTWRYKIITTNVHQPGRFVRICILFIVIFLLFQHYQTLLGRDAGVAMLIALTMLKFLELKSLRDYMLVVFLCLFIVMTSFLYSQSLWLGFYLLAVVIILFTVMMYLNHRDRRDLLGMLKRAASLVMVGLPVAILLFVLFPRLQGSLFGLPGDSHSGLTGMSDTMKPGTINELNLSEKVAFRVEFLAQPPTAKQRYWRGLVLENYQQGTWKENKNAKATGSPVKFSADDLIEYTILQEATNKKWVFALDMPVSKPAGLTWGSGQTLRSNKNMYERQQNLIQSALVYEFNDMSEIELAINMDISAISGRRVTELAQKLYQQSDSDRDYISNVLAYYRNNDFVYNLQPPLLDGEPVETFMFDTREGYCEHYASSFTMMMRLAGVPARVVIGYQGGEWNEQGNYLIVRQSDAHAWSEVWLDDSGWVRVDPTSAVAPERIEYGISAIRQLLEQGQELGNLTEQQLQSALSISIPGRVLKNLKLFWDGANTRWYKWVIGFGSKNQINILKWFGFKQASVNILIFLLVVLVSLVVIIQAWVLFHRKKVLDPAVRQYQIYCHRLSRIGIERSTSEGPLAFAQRVLSLRPDLRELVLPVVEAYIAIRYAGNISNEQHQKLIRAVRKFKPEERKIALNNS